MAALVVLAVLITVLCLSEYVCTHWHKLDRWLDRFLGGDAEGVEAYDAHEFNARHPKS